MQHDLELRDPRKLEAVVPVRIQADASGVLVAVVNAQGIELASAMLYLEGGKIHLEVLCGGPARTPAETSFQTDVVDGPTITPGQPPVEMVLLRQAVTRANRYLE